MILVERVLLLQEEASALARNFTQVCSGCSAKYDSSTFVTACSKCGGLIDFEYDPVQNWEKEIKKTKGLMRFSNLLPIKYPSRAVSCGSQFDNPSPLFNSRDLGSHLGLKNLWIKDETKNFTRTFKAREAIVTISRFQELGIREFVMCSTGNTAAAFCYAMRRANVSMKAHLVFPHGTLTDFSTDPIAEIKFFDGNYEESIKFARKCANEIGVPFEGGFANACRREGSKTLTYEVAEAGLRPEWYVQAVGSGTGIYGYSRATRELRSMGLLEESARILCCQPAGCSPFVEAFRADSDVMNEKYIVRNPKTFATTLANGNPSFSYPYIHEIVKKSRGYAESVSETEIGESLVLLAKLEGIIADPAAAVALAGLIKCIERGIIDRDSVILLNISGGIRVAGNEPPI